MILGNFARQMLFITSDLKGKEGRKELGKKKGRKVTKYENRKKYVERERDRRIGRTVIYTLINSNYCS